MAFSTTRAEAHPPHARVRRWITWFRSGPAPRPRARPGPGGPGTLTGHGVPTWPVVDVGAASRGG